VTLHNWPAAERHLWCGESPLQIGPWIAECLAVQWPVLAEGESQRHGLTATAGTANTLPVVGDRRRHVGHHHGRNRADVDAHLHRGGAVEDVDLAGLEFALVASQPSAALLCRVLGRTRIVGE
jgi:hypothetical protein